MAYVKNTIRIVLFLVFGALFHYVLPQHDVVRVTGTEIIRMDFSSMNRIFFAQADSASAELATRDIRLLNTVKRKTFLLGFYQREAEGVMVYRNEDTGWIWPPYFKFDSSDLQAEALANVSTPDNEQWVKITHYGWRNRFFTVYPNAIAITPIDGPEVRIIPWFNIFFFGFLIVGLLFMRAMWRQFRERTIDPAMEDAGDAWERVDAHADQARGRFGRWLDSWRGKR
ncbi:DUF1523 family protein [Aliiroseovarius subalbicans]|uniref:DUF1523 family protein n=1 Tax=Aliiroseovarius subalbicans TaxID=2925840 RepID=UPI001F58755C|nr:DUF1523 family protein [Aliiroseovarius subalbicans]MCI2400549.1 DUF1523 family protein [Aliiroseovarius subalbicans]